MSCAIGFALMVAFVPGWGGAATTPRWDVFVLIAFALFCSPPGRMTQAHWLGIALVAWFVASSVWSVAPLNGIDAAAKLLAVAVAFTFGTTLHDLRPFVIGAALGLTISSLIAIDQWYGWHGLDQALDATISSLVTVAQWCGWNGIDQWSWPGIAQYGEPSGLFYSGNRLAEAALLVFAAALGLRLWWVIPGLVPAIVLPYERTVWIAAGIVISLWVWRRADGFARFVFGAIAAQIVFGLAITSAIWRTSEFGFEGIVERVALVSFVLDHLSVFGHGLGAFVHDGPILAWPVPGALFDRIARAEHPHNEWLWLAYEGGAVAVALAVGFAVAVWRACDDDLRLVLVALFVVSCFAMPFHDPATIGMAVVCAGFGVGASRRVRVAAHVGGSALRAWVAAELERGGERRGAGASSAALPVPAAVS